MKKEVLVLILMFTIHIAVIVILTKLWQILVIPKIIKGTTKTVEKNPTWLTSKLRSTYYGFSNIDILIVKSALGDLPRFNFIKNKNEEPKLELLLAEDTSVDEIELIAQLALRGKILLQYGLVTPNDKSTEWLSTLLYMLDGGDAQRKIIS